MTQPATTETHAVIIDTATGERGDMRAWVVAFAHVWAAPRERLDGLMNLLAADVVLKAPTRPSKTIGQDAGRRAFERAFRAMPDLSADVERWSAADDVLFIEMTFHATIGGHSIAWRSIDRILYRDGIAVERRAFFDPSKVRRAFLRNPSALRQLLRLRFAI